MLKIYDSKGDSFPLADYEDFCITHKLDGCDEMSFCLDVRHKQYSLLFEEQQIESDNNIWLIKKIDDDRIDCELDFDFLKQSIYTNYKSEEKSLTQVLESHMPDGWSIEGANISSIKKTIEFDMCTDYDIIYSCMSTYDVYFVWKIKEKRLVVYSAENMLSTGEYLTSELNLTALSFKGETTSFATRLYAYGADGLTMEDAVIENSEGKSVKYGKTYVENRSYADKTVCAYWSDDSYTVPERLYHDALEKINTLSFPVRSYECEVVDLAKRNEKYSFLDFKIHKKVTLIDVDRNIKVEHQIVEYKEYPDEPDRNKITLSCVPQTIQTSITNVVDSIETETEKLNTDFQKRLLMSTAMLTGAFGSYLHRDDSELFMMDKEDPAQAQVVWRWNANGFGKSSTGIDGPYTTALTMDDNFITNVITAMVIRGDLIEANSIKAGSLSQSYKDEVTNEIDGKTRNVEQSFIAADEHLLSEIKKTENNLNENLGQLETTVSELKQTVSDINMSFSSQTIGGINLIKNSSGLNGVSNDWTKTGSVTIDDGTEAINNTSSGSMFGLRVATLEQTVKVIKGKKYTLSFKAFRDTDKLCNVRINNGSKDVQILSEQKKSTEWEEYSKTVTAAGDTLTLRAETTGYYFYVADFMLVEGEQKSHWTPAPNELYTENVKVDRRGIHITNPDSYNSTLIDHTQFAIKHHDDIVLSVKEDLTTLLKTQVTGELEIGEGKGKYIPADKGFDLVIFD